MPTNQGKHKAALCNTLIQLPATSCFWDFIRYIWTIMYHALQLSSYQCIYLINSGTQILLQASTTSYVSISHQAIKLCVEKNHHIFHTCNLKANYSTEIQPSRHLSYAGNWRRHFLSFGTWAILTLNPHCLLPLTSWPPASDFEQVIHTNFKHILWSQTT